MTDSKQILELAQNNNGVITTEMVVKAGFSRGVLKYLSDTGNLEHTSRGVYILPDVLEDEFVNIQNRYKRGIYALDTALFLCDLVFPSAYNLSNPKQAGIICSSAREPYYSLGLTEVLTPGGNPVRSYCVERSLCDILKPKNHTDVQIITDAFKRYTARKEKNITLLSDYAKALKVEDKCRSYLEVLL